MERGSECSNINLKSLKAPLFSLISHLKRLQTTV